MPYMCIRKEIYVNVVERTKSAPYFSIVLLRGKHTLARCVCMEGEGRGWLSGRVSRGEALKSLEKVSVGCVAEDRGGDAGGSQR
jgi:hypothetical protein